MSFNPDVLRFVNVTEGDFLDRQPEGTFPAIRVGPNRITFGWSTQGDYIGESGSGTLATIEFEVLAEGESLLDFETDRIFIRDAYQYVTFIIGQTSPNPPPNFVYLYPDAMVVDDGLFVNTVAPPQADFTYAPDPASVGEPITFDASASSAVSPLVLTEYFWDFGDGTNATVTTPTIEHTYTTGGTYMAVLTVFDNAVAPDLVQQELNTTVMPRVWYELFGTKTASIGLAFGHDVAVTNVSTSTQQVTAGDTVSITVTVKNLGIETEDFDVTVYYGTTAIETQSVADLNTGAEQTLTVDWNTAGVPAGNYQIKAVASTVEDETNVANNEFTDGTVEVLATTDEFPTLLVVGAVVGVVAVILIVVYFMRRRSSA
jgi:PKD repeat protein